jgi:NAD(P)-dependent dehydrogenase (short-subunit alcohol dehydrogenase family)
MTSRRRVAVVAGGGGGIGSEVCLELARRGLAVVALDTGDDLFGNPVGDPSAETIAQRVRELGGTALASTASVTDRAALRELFAQVVDEFGSLDVVVNTAGILRFPRFLEATQDDWTAVLDVHVNGYLSVLAEALPHMVAAGYGRIVGISSGAGLARTSADGAAYGAGKRCVAAITWELAKLLPAGVCINALSPIAASRMVREILLRLSDSPDRSLDLSRMPQPADMAPAAAYMASERFGWARGQVIFSAGPELTLIAPPRLIEIVRSDAADRAATLGTVFPVVLNPAEAAQRTTGGSNPRFGDIFSQTQVTSHPRSGRTLVLCSQPHLAKQLSESLARWGREVLVVDPRSSDFDYAEACLDSALAAGPLDEFVVALGAPEFANPDALSWEQVVASSAGVGAHIVANAAWLRAAGRLCSSVRHPLRITFATDATSPAGRLAAQAIAQVARSVNDTPTNVGTQAMAVSLESAAASDLAAAADLIARLCVADDALALAGAELAVGASWLGLRSHPEPITTVSFGSTTIPEWVDSALRLTLGGAPGASATAH